MPHTEALYFPSIDIRDDAWLRSSLLYWDAVHTIVPEGVADPYAGRFAKECADANALRPLHISGETSAYATLGEEALSYVYSTVGQQAIAIDNSTLQVANDVQHLSHIHPDKLSSNTVQTLLRRGARYSHGRLAVGGGFPAYYMTLLAATLAQEHGFALATTIPECSGLADAARAGASPQIVRRGELHRVDLLEGLRIDLVMRRLKVRDNADLAEILRFKNEHKNELGRFRNALSELTSAPEPATYEALIQHVRDFEKNSLDPALAQLDEAMKAVNLGAAIDGVVKVGFFSSASAIPSLLSLGVSTPLATAAGGVLGSAASVVKYRMDRRATLRTSPFTYLSLAQSALGER
jgi:hypothetical protein